MSQEYASVVASGAEGQANINIWLKDLTPWVPGCHRSVMKRQLILAMREFFEQSWAWRATIGPIALVTNQQTYMLSPFNSTTDVVGIVNAAINGVQLPPISQRPPDSQQGTPLSNSPWGFYMVRPDIMAVYPIPNVTAPPQNLLVQVALRPKMSVSQVPHIAVTDFYEAIMDGALYRLLNQPAKSYSNPALAAYFENKFRTAIGYYAGKAKKGFNNGPSWRFPYFGNGRGSIWQ